MNSEKVWRERNDGYWVKWEEAQSSIKVCLWEEKQIVREAYILSIDHRRQDGNHNEVHLCQISNRTNPRDPWWVEGLRLPWRSWLTDLIVSEGTPSLDGTSQKDLYFVPKSLIVLETGLIPGIWEASLESYPRSDLMLTEKTPSDWLLLVRLQQYWRKK